MRFKYVFIAYFLLAFLGERNTSYGQIKVDKIASLPTVMYETSGLVYYKKDVLITHNDGGNKSEIFVLTKSGELLKTIDVEDTKNRDWEDLAQDDKGNLFIGDFGNNLNKYEKNYIYILEDGFLEKKNVAPKKITFNYPEQKDFPPKDKEMNYDCEAMIWVDGYLYLFTKCRTKPFTGISRVYRIPDTPGKYKAELLGEIQLCSTNWNFCSVTAADYNPQTNTLALLTYSKLYLLKNIQNLAFWNAKMYSYDISFVKQREAICFKNNNTLFMTDEYRKGLKGGNLYELSVN